jgi:hypothetical protein
MVDMLQLATANLVSPIILFFALGLAAALAKSKSSGDCELLMRQSIFRDSHPSVGIRPEWSF